MRVNRDVVCMMIVEELEGMANVREIAAVDGVTGIGIGPGDLSMALGAASWDDERVTSALDAMTETVRQQPGCAAMRLALDTAAVADLVQKGVNMVLATHDAHLIKDMYRTLFKDFRDAAAISPATPARS
jgi:2-keto-3-deoxy-L-rhamnonate aldolase RhmA